MDSIGNILDSPFFEYCATFVVESMNAIECSGESLVGRRVGKEVARQLPRQELVVWKIFIERSNNPVAVGHCVFSLSRLIAVGVGVAGRI